MLRIRNDLFRIQIQLWIWVPEPNKTVSTVYLEIIKNTLNLIKKINLTTTVFAILYLMLQSYSTNSPEFRVFFIRSFTLSLIRNWNNNSGSRQKIRLHADSDPQHCYFGILKISWFVKYKVLYLPVPDNWLLCRSSSCPREQSGHAPSCDPVNIQYCRLFNSLKRCLWL